MKSTSPSPSSWSVAGLYLFGTLLFFWPFADLLSNSLPVQLGSLHWRYGFAGLMAAYLNTPVLGLVLLMAVAYALEHTRTLRALAVFEIVMALGLLAVIFVFALDLVQVRASRPATAQGAVLAGGVIAILKHFSAVAVLVLLGIGGWRTAARRARERPEGRAGVVIKPKEATRPSS